MKYLRVKKWDEHQHYTDRDPPWIKVYNRLLDDYEFLSLSEVAQIHLVKLWLLASRMENKIPYDLSFIVSKICPRTALDIEGLIVAGWLELSDVADIPKRPAKARNSAQRKKKDRARKALSRRMQSASTSASVLPLETETETETETELLTGVRTPVENWVAAAVEIFAPVGTFSHGRIGKALSPVVARFGWPDTRLGLADYLAAPNRNGGKKPEYFRDESGTWVIGAREPLVDSGGVPTARADRILGVGR